MSSKFSTNRFEILHLPHIAPTEARPSSKTLPNHAKDSQASGNSLVDSKLLYLSHGMAAMLFWTTLHFMLFTAKRRRVSNVKS